MDVVAPELEMDDWEMTQDGFNYPPAHGANGTAAAAAAEAEPMAEQEEEDEGDEDEEDDDDARATASEEGDALVTRGEGHEGHATPPPVLQAAGGKRAVAEPSPAIMADAGLPSSSQASQPPAAGERRARKKSRPSLEMDGVTASFGRAASLARNGSGAGRKAPRRFDCNLYGPIAMDGLCLEIIDTPQFQRLGYISQLGACPLVYRGATHTRLQHSLGVAHLAETFVRTLIRNQPELLGKGVVRDKDILCVKVAGLCHDLGHGPFSHAFEYLIERIAAKEGHLPERAYLREWKHEDMSLRLLDALIQENGIDLRKYDLDAQDLVFIKECIVGTPPAERQGGRDGVRAFLYDVVNNARSGLDVDKLDYFKRDARNCAVDITPGWERMMEEARVALAEGLPGHDVQRGEAVEQSYQIVFKRRHLGSALTWFSTRYKLHAHVYQNKVVKEVELMLSDILLQAEPHLRIPGPRDEATGEVLESFRISETLDHGRAPGNLTAFCNLTDSLLDRIMSDFDSALQPSRRLIQRLRRRDLFTSVGSIPLSRELERSILASAPSVVSAPAPTAGAGGHHALIERVHQEIVRRFQRLLAAAQPQPPSSHSATTTPASTVSTSNHSYRHNGCGGAASSSTAAPPPPLRTEEEAQDLVHVERTVLHYGKGEHNPVLSMRFLDFHGRENGNGNGGVRIARQVSESQLEPCLLPQAFWSRKLRVFCKRREYKELVHRAFLDWCQHVQQEPLEECGGLGEEGEEEDGDSHHDL